MGRMQLISSSTNFVELSWNRVPYVNHFILQIQLCPIEMDKSYSFEDMPHFSPSLIPVPNKMKPQPISTYHNTSMPSSHNFNRHLPQMAKEIQSSCSPKPSFASQSLKYNFHPNTKRQSVNTNASLNDPSNKPYSSSPSQVCFNYSPAPRNAYPSFNIRQSSKLPNSSRIEPFAVSKPPQTPISSEQSPTSPLPIVITIPPVCQEEQPFKQQPVFASHNSYSCMSPVMSRPNTSKSNTTTSIAKPIPSHIPVACAPVAPRSALSASQITPERSSPSSCKSGNLITTDLLPYSSSAAISQSEENKTSMNLFCLIFILRL